MWIPSGIFIFITLFVAYLYLIKHKEFNWARVIKNFSIVSLSIYLLEVTLSESVGRALLLILPDWNQTINGCLLFGFFNVIIWLVILMFWSKSNFKYSLEYFWVLFFKKIGKTSTKMSHLNVKKTGGN